MADPHVGTVVVEVAKASGTSIANGMVCCALSLGSQKQVTRQVACEKDAIVEWKESFEFKVAQPTDLLLATLWRTCDSGRDRGKDVVVGRQTIPLKNLATGRRISKWYQLSNDNTVLLLRMEYHLTYSLGKTAKAGITQFPTYNAQLEDHFQRRVEASEADSEANTKPTHLVDYFLVIGAPGEQVCALSPLEPSQGKVGSGRLLSPVVLHQYPAKRKDLPVPRQIPLFCFSNGYEVRCELRRPAASFFGFKLTDGQTAVYGTALVFWEDIARIRFGSSSAADDSQPAEPAAYKEDVRPRYWAPRALCILTRHAFIPQFRAILIELYRLFCAGYPLQYDELQRWVHPLAPTVFSGNNGVLPSLDVRSPGHVAFKVATAPTSPLFGRHGKASVPSGSPLGNGSTSPRAPSSPGGLLELSRRQAEQREQSQEDSGATPLATTAGRRTPPNTARTAPPLLNVPSDPTGRASAGTLRMSPTASGVPVVPIGRLPLQRSRTPQITVSSGGLSTPLAAAARLEPFESPTSFAGSPQRAVVWAREHGNPSLSDEQAKQCRDQGLDWSGRSLEDYITLLVEEVPLPVPGGTGVGFRVGSLPVMLHFPAQELEFPHLELSLQQLFRVLDTQVVVKALGCILTESQVLFHSSQLSLLLLVQECLLALCFPFAWEHVYVPLLPKELLNVLQAPVPFVVGVHSDCITPSLHEQLYSSQVFIVDIDQGDIECSVPPPSFPRVLHRNLVRHVNALVKPHVAVADHLGLSSASAPSAPQPPYHTPGVHAYSVVSCARVEWDRKRRAPHYPRATSTASTTPHPSRADATTSVWTPPHLPTQRAVRRAFLRFLADVLQDYRNFIFFVNGCQPIFDTPGYLQHRSAAMPFLSRFLETQLFTSFLEKHVESPSFLQDYIVYIDDPTTLLLRQSAFSGGSLTFSVPSPPPMWERDTARSSDDTGDSDTAPSGSSEQETKTASDEHKSAVIPSYELWPLVREELIPIPREFRLPTAHFSAFDWDSGSESETEEEYDIANPDESKTDSNDETNGHVGNGAHRRSLSSIVVTDNAVASDVDMAHRRRKSLSLQQGHSLGRMERNASGRLRIKSLVEERKDVEDTRMHRLLRRLVQPPAGPTTPGSGPTFPRSPSTGHDMAEMSAVGELLKFEYWRQMLVSILHRSISQPRSGSSGSPTPARRSGNARGNTSSSSRGSAFSTASTAAADLEREVSEENFRALVLLFGIAIQESTAANDLETVRQLLELSGALYNYAGDNSSAADNSDDTVPVATGPRQYLCYAVKHHSIWRSEAFWQHSFKAALAKQLRRQERARRSSSKESPGQVVRSLDSTTPSAASSAATQEPTVATAPLSSASTTSTGDAPAITDSQRAAMIFDLVAKYVYKMLSMGLDVAFTAKFATDACETHKLSDEQTSTLVQLASNIYMTAHITTRDYGAVIPDAGPSGSAQRAQQQRSSAKPPRKGSTSDLISQWKKKFSSRRSKTMASLSPPTGK